MPTNKNSDDAGQAEVQAASDDATEKGYFGVTPDPTPNENYTLRGVTSGAPTPETDAEQADKARLHALAVSRGEVQ